MELRAEPDKGTDRRMARNGTRGEDMAREEPGWPGAAGERRAEPGVVLIFRLPAIGIGENGKKNEKTPKNTG